MSNKFRPRALWIFCPQGYQRSPRAEECHIPNSVYLSLERHRVECENVGVGGAFQKETVFGGLECFAGQSDPFVDANSFICQLLGRGAGDTSFEDLLFGIWKEFRDTHPHKATQNDEENPAYFLYWEAHAKDARGFVCPRWCAISYIIMLVKRGTPAKSFLHLQKYTQIYKSYKRFRRSMCS